MKISVIVTVLNEATTIGRLLIGLENQTRPPDEVVIVDGGSTDGTFEKLLNLAQKKRRWSLKVLQKKRQSKCGAKLCDCTSCARVNCDY